MDSDTQRYLDERISEYAGRQDVISRVSRGVDPEEVHEIMYYVYVESRSYLFDLSDSLCELETLLALETGASFTIFQWPAREGASFLGKAIYQSRKTKANNI